MLPNRGALAVGKALLIVVAALSFTSPILDDTQRYPVAEQGRAAFLPPHRYRFCGGVYRPTDNVISHPTLPCNTVVLVRNPGNGKEQLTVVKERGWINQRRNQIIAVSPGLAKDLGIGLSVPFDVHIFWEVTVR